MTDSKTFSGLYLNKWIIKQCLTIGVKSPTPIQANCIPHIMRGVDCIGAAKTGSGKTLAFALPIIQKLCDDPYGIFALILTPTRELAYQIADQFAVIGKPMNIRCSVIVGGVDMVEQGIQLSKHPHIVVATPGRLADHLESCKTFSLSRIRFLVVDEADRLLGGQFDEQIKTIFKNLPKTRQNLFFSATITDTLETLKKVSNREVVLYQDPSLSDVATVDQLEQYYVLCPTDVKEAYLVEVIREFRSEDEEGSIMIFTDTCKNCQVLSMTLNEVGFENAALHSMLPQQQRLAALARFKSKTVRILFATDVASRGLDIPTVSLVINHSVPKIPKEYIHRVGRTARAGRIGKAITLVTPYDIKLLQSIEQLIKTKLKEFKVDDSEVGKIFTQVSVTKSEAFLKLDEEDFYEKALINKRKKWILEGLDPDEEEAKLFKKKKGKRKENNMNKTPISILQEYMVQQKKAAPIYRDELSDIPEHTFKCIVTAGNVKACGYASTKKEAKHNSAHAALKKIGFELNLKPNNNVILPRIEIKGLLTDNYVGKLNELASTSGKPYATYEDEVIPQNGKFYVKCHFLEWKSEGYGVNKKSAKQDAAKKMLEMLSRLMVKVVPINLVLLSKKTYVAPPMARW
ncbi:hypothetical protein JTB14_027824 [Gonioctena quinquepunctata]|nr:hypothetical protein JTB14_027824 [Gonioctena quinquepunctata]